MKKRSSKPSYFFNSTYFYLRLDAWWNIVFKVTTTESSIFLQIIIILSKLKTIKAFIILNNLNIVVDHWNSLRMSSKLVFIMSSFH